MRSLLLLTLLSATATLGVSGCNDLGVGRKCVNPQVGMDGKPAPVNGIALVSPALECPTRLCFLDSDTSRDVCTASCATNDDCVGAVSGDPMNGQCNTGFVCAVATETGPFCCKKICVCKDDLVAGVNKDDNGNVQTPSACMAGASSCPNIGH